MEDQTVEPTYATEMGTEVQVPGSEEGDELAEVEALSLDSELVAEP